MSTSAIDAMIANAAAAAASNTTAASQAPTKFASYACSVANGCLTAVAWALGAYK